MISSDVNRVILIVLDSAGVGEMPDAADYGDTGSNTLGHIAEAVGGLNLPNLQRLGLGNIIPIAGVPAIDHPQGCFGKMAEKSVGKDTTTGHWEMSGIVVSRHFPTYPDGFPDDVIESFEAVIGRSTLGNYPASGTEIIKELGPEHIRTGFPIVYTSADSVFQIACHEDIVPIEQLYEWCEAARIILVEPNDVLRVIARPFVGTPGSFTRTERRKDFSLPPIGRTVLDAVYGAGETVIAIGKIGDIFAETGISESIHTGNNEDGIRSTIETIRSGKGNLVFVNLVDFDMMYGHRNDPAGYARALQVFDAHLPELIDAMHSDDVLMISADHGCDPTTPGTDHTREYVPIIAYRPGIAGSELGVRYSFCDVAATIADLLHVPGFPCGESFAEQLLLV